MLFSTLTYPVEQPYRLRWITEIFYFGSAIIVVLLVVFNIALVGYEEVIVLRKDPNITDYDQWWAPKSLPSALRFRTTPGECQETNLPRNTLLRTNSSLPLFTYSLINNLENFDAQKDEFGLRSETPYKANPMDICRVENMSLTMEPRILSFAISTTIICDPVGVPPRARRFQTWFKGAQDDRYRPDSILEYMSYRATPNDTDIASYQKLSKDGPPRNTYLNVLGVIDGLHSDLINLMWMRKSTLTHMNDTSSEYPPELASMAWDSQLDSRLPGDVSRLSYWGTYTEGWWTDYDTYIGKMNRTIANLFVAIRDAIYLDVGKTMPTNIYTNKTSLNNLIRVDKYSTELSQAMFEIYDWQDLNSDPTCSRGWGCLDFNTTWAEAFTSTNGSVNNITLPIIPDNGTASVIDMTYLCPQYRMKSLGDLLMSVFIGTFTMYVTLYGIFAWLAPALDQQRKGPQPSERFITGQSLGPDYELQVGSLTPRSSSYVPPYDSLGFDDDQKRLLDDEKDKTP